MNASREKEKTNSLTNICKEDLQSECPTLPPLAEELRLYYWGNLDMFIVKVAWDARHQQFRLLDPKLAHMFEHDDMYLLVVDFFPQDIQDDDQFIDLDQADIGHA